MKRYLVLLAAGVLVLGAQAYAHHSFAATYLEDQTQTIEGEVVQFLFRSPHSFLNLNVKEKDGTVVRYSAEWAGAAQLGGQGVSRETFKPGDVVIISGSPGRNPADHRIRLVSLKRPKDGFGWGLKAGEVNVD
jgi:hypothetical protein